MNKGFCSFIVMIALLLISSCQPAITDDEEKMPGIDVPVKEFNQKFELLIYPGTQESPDEEMLTFLVRNKSKETIIFEQDFGTRIL